MTQDEAPAALHEEKGVVEWLDVVDQALQGLHHALNNRIGSLSAVVELHQLGDAAASAAALEGLAADLKRIEDVNRVIRLLPRDAVVGEESLILDDVLADVLAIHRFLHDVRERQVTIAPTRYVEPVRLERWAAVRVLTLLLHDAKRLAKAENTAVRGAAESDEQWVRVEFRVGAPLVDAIPMPVHAPYADRVAESFGGGVTRKPGIVELRLPTLKARRAADRR